jgi:hypothetical protein
MRRASVVAAFVLALSGCSGSGKTAAPAVPSTPAAAPASPTPDQKIRVLECGGFDLGVADLNDVWPQFVAGTIPVGYGITLSKVSDQWQTVLNDAPTDTLADAIDRAKGAVDDIATQIRDASGGGTVQLGYQAATLYSAWEDVHVACEKDGYNLTQTLAPAN